MHLSGLLVTISDNFLLSLATWRRFSFLCSLHFFFFLSGFPILSNFLKFSCSFWFSTASSGTYCWLFFTTSVFELILDLSDSVRFLNSLHFPCFLATISRTFFRAFRPFESCQLFALFLLFGHNFKHMQGLCSANLKTFQFSMFLHGFPTSHSFEFCHASAFFFLLGSFPSLSYVLVFHACWGFFKKLAKLSNVPVYHVFYGLFQASSFFRLSPIFHIFSALWATIFSIILGSFLQLSHVSALHASCRLFSNFLFLHILLVLCNFCFLATLNILLFFSSSLPLCGNFPVRCIFFFF